MQTCLWWIESLKEQHLSNIEIISNNIKVFTVTSDQFNESFVNKCIHLFTTRIPEMLGRVLNLNKMKTKRLSNHMSKYFIHNRT